jgi:hypothetical protein
MPPSRDGNMRIRSDAHFAACGQNLNHPGFLQAASHF